MNHFSMKKKAFFQFIKAEQRSLEERKESVMNLQETDLAGAERVHIVGSQIMLAFASLRLAWFEFEQKMPQFFFSIFYADFVCVFALRQQ